MSTRTKYFIAFTLLLLVFGCSQVKKANSSAGDTRTRQVVLIDDNTYLLVERSQDASYGFTQSNPVKVGGSAEGSGPKNERRYLNALLGPGGEKIGYYRFGSCCPFETPNGIFNNTGMLDRYRIFWTGSPDTLDIYFNFYDKGDLLIPTGLSAKKIN